MTETSQARKGAQTSTAEEQTTTDRAVQTTADQGNALQQNVVDLSKYPVGSVVTLRHGNKTLQVKIKEEAFIPDFAKLIGDVAVDHAREFYVFAENVFHKVNGSEYALRNVIANIRDQMFKDGKKEAE